MISLRQALRKKLRWVHLWMGLITGIFICLMGVTGTIVTFRPQISAWMSPSAKSPNGCVEATDWNRAEKQIESFAGSKVNRLYFPAGTDPRVQIRVMGDSEKVYRHVTFDGCAGQVLGSVHLGWMYWLVDLHHNLLYEQVGRRWAGLIGIFLLFSSVGGILLWFLGKPSLTKIFHIQTRRSGVRTSLDLHRAFGLASLPLLLLASFTGIWFCFPQTMRGLLVSFTTVTQDTRPAPRRALEATATRAGLGDAIQAARHAIPDGNIREIRMPEGNGNFTIRMWRAGDFRSLGNNVVFVDSTDAHVLAVDLYEGKPAGNRFIQAMAGLHYGEWGGIAYRTIYGIAALATVVLFATGVLMWWIPKSRRSTARSRNELVVSELSPDVAKATSQDTSTVMN